jgi:hypothetical protein
MNVLRHIDIMNLLRHIDIMNYRNIFLQHFYIRFSAIGSSHYDGSSMWIAQVNGHDKAIPVQAWRDP